MRIEDLGIIESQWRVRLSEAPAWELFESVGELLVRYYSTADLGREGSNRELIGFAKAFASWVGEFHAEERIREIYACKSEEEGLTALIRSCFGAYGPYRTGQGETETNLAQTLIGQPLGVQKQHARLHHRGRHEALLYTPWPAVVEILCQNPSVHERDILFMASRRPTQNCLLEAILKSRWASSPEIRFALASNPYFNVGHALRCAGTLSRKYLRDLSQSPDIHAFVRDQAHCLLALQARQNKSDG